MAKLIELEILLLNLNEGGFQFLLFKTDFEAKVEHFSNLSTLD